MPTFCWRIRQLCLEPVLEIRWKDGTIIVQHHQVPRFHNLATCGLEVPDSDWTRKPPRPLLGHGLGFRLPIFRIFRFAPETMRSPEVSAGHPWPSRATHRWRGDHPSWGPSDARRWSWSENLWPMWFSDILGTCISILRTYIYIHTSSYIIIYHYISIYYLKKNNYEHLTSDIVHQRISKILQLYLYDLYGVFRKLWRKAAVGKANLVQMHPLYRRHVSKADPRYTVYPNPLVRSGVISPMREKLFDKFKSHYMGLSKNRVAQNPMVSHHFPILWLPKFWGLVCFWITPRQPCPRIPEHPRPWRVKDRAILVGDAAGYVTKCSGHWDRTIALVTSQF